MTDFLVKGVSTTERAQLYAAFPTVAPADLEAVIQVLPTSREVALPGGKSYPVKTLLSADAEEVLLAGSLVRVPGRVYFAEPVAGAEQVLTGRQQGVLHCLYLRHHDGYVRQRRLEQLLAIPVEAFTVPFTFSLIGDYVKEILEVLQGALTPELLPVYIAFIRENPLYWQRTKGRVASYWNVYYRWRGARHFRYYVGARLLARLQQACLLAGITNK
jgi:hypothetical protein